MSPKGLLDLPLYSLRLEGHITALSPISIVTPNSDTVPLDAGGKANEIATMMVLYGDEPIEVPVITASTIRGRIRHAAVAAALEHLPEKPSLEAYVYAAVGGVKGSEAEDAFSLVERDARRGPNPVLGLFGSSRPWDAGRAYIENATPSSPIKPATKSATRTDDMAREPALVRMLDTGAADDYLKMRGENRLRIEATNALRDTKEERARLKRSGEDAAAKELGAKILQLEAEFSATKKEVGNPLLMPHAHRYIPQGTIFNHSMLLNRVTGVEIGLFLDALDRVFLDNPFFGARASHYYGKVSATWQLRLRPVGAREWRDAGNLTATPFEGIAHSDDELSGFQSAWQDFAQSGKLNLSLDR